MIRVLVVDDHELIRVAVSAALDAVEGVEVIGACDNGADAVALCAQTHPDVVVMDLVMPVMDGVEATGLVMAAQPNCRIVILTAAGPSHKTREALAAGAATCVFKDLGMDELITAVHGDERWRIAGPP